MGIPGDRRDERSCGPRRISFAIQCDLRILFRLRKDRLRLRAPRRGSEMGMHCTFVRCADHSDAVDGITSLLERRDPSWTARRERIPDGGSTR
jgi:hypothetical protein